MTLFVERAYPSKTVELADRNGDSDGFGDDRPCQLHYIFTMVGIRKYSTIALIFLSSLLTTKAFQVSLRPLSQANFLSGQPTKLEALPNPFMTPTDSKAALSLLASSWVGVNMDRKFAGSGIVATLCASTILSSLRWAPSSHVLYEASWSTFLPASLVFLLLSLPIKSVPGKLKQGKFTGQGVAAVLRLSIPFVIACLGSMVGCACSFRFFSTTSIANFRMARSDALMAASCLVASFIGGSVNFLATANAIASSVATNVHSKTLVSSMATADVLVMALYLSGLSLAVRSAGLRQWFGGSSSSSVSSSGDSMSTRFSPGPSTVAFGTFPTAATCILLAWGIVNMSNRIEPVISSLIPGSACAIITLVTPLVQRVLLQTRLIDSGMLQSVSSRLFNYTFLLLFASMGMSISVPTVLQNAPVCFGFSCLALAVHSLVTLLGTKLYRSLVNPSVTLDDALMASNAAIGGATTAAAFAGQAPAQQRKGLIVAGTVWGVFGYAIGTTAGLTLFRWLSRW